MKTCVAAVVLLSLLSAGLSAPLNSCDRQVKPITLSTEDMLGSWLYVGGSSDIPGSRSLAHLMTSVSLNITATGESDVLNLIQTQRTYGECSSFTYNVTFKNSTMSIEQPFYLKEVYLPTNCSDCLVVYEDVVSGGDSFTSLLLFSRRQSVSPAVVEEFRTQAECFRMPKPIMMNKDSELCPDDASPTDGLSALNSVLEAKMGHRVAKLLDTFFEMFVN